MKKWYVQDGNQNNKFSIRKNSHVTKIWKNTFQKDFFNKIWLKAEEYELYFWNKI